MILPNGGSFHKDATILVIGAGTWGTSIAYQLAKHGYQHITVLDAHEFPSPISAGNDLNKILEEPDQLPNPSQSDEDYAWSTIETIAAEQWKEDPLYKPHYHENGFIYAAVSDEAYAKVVAACEGRSEYVKLNGTQAFRDTMPEEVLKGNLPGWRGYIRRKRAGWVAASATMKATHKRAEELGVRFVTGNEGTVKSLDYSADDSAIIGATTINGTSHTASLSILAIGANSEHLLDFRKQLRPTAWTLAHIPLTPAEAQLFRNLPVLYGVDRGFFIEPSPGGNELKICDEHPGYLNFVFDERRGEKRSVPFARNQIPRASETRIRDFLRETLPQLADGPFSFARLCWDADTVDRMFLIGRYPRCENLIVAVGGSGHGFMCSPAVGVLVADLVQGRLDERMERILGWREEQALGRNWWDTQGRFGVETKVMDLQGVKDWTNIKY